MNKTKHIAALPHQLTWLFCVSCIFGFLLLNSCSQEPVDSYKDNTPTSGDLKVYYEEGLEPHVKNQARTFESQYPRARVHLFQSSEGEAVKALFNDSCEAIVISRLFSEQEKKAFASKSYSPQPCAVAKSGVAVICNPQLALSTITYEEIVKLLREPYQVADSSGKENTVTVLFDKNNSSVLHYITDSVLKGAKLSSQCSILNSTLESINYVAANKNSIAFIDFAWISDADDSVYKANKDKIRILAVSKAKSDTFELPSQSSFKLGTYPFTRTVYVFRKTGDFTLAKGFETYVAGPKGQLTFLKQGLLPNRQSERAIEVKLE